MFKVYMCREKNQIKSPQGLKFRGWEFHRRARLHGSGCDPTPRQTRLLRTMQIRFYMSDLRLQRLWLMHRDDMRFILRLGIETPTTSTIGRHPDGSERRRLEHAANQIRGKRGKLTWSRAKRSMERA